MEGGGGGEVGAVPRARIAEFLRWRFAPPPRPAPDRRWASSGRGDCPSPPTVHLAGTGAEKSGVCPALEVDLNCRQEFLSDGDCADNLKCCWLAVPPSARHPKATPGTWGQGGDEAGQAGKWLEFQVPGNGGTPDPGIPGQIEVDGTRSARAVPPRVPGETKASLKRIPGQREAPPPPAQVGFQACARAGLASSTRSRDRVLRGHRTNSTLLRR